MVYFLQGVEGGPIKIGYCGAKRLGNRFKEIQTSHPQELQVCKTIPGSRTHEWELHQRFATERLYGEWFKATPELAAIADAKVDGEYEAAYQRGFADGLASRQPGTWEARYKDLQPAFTRATQENAALRKALHAMTNGSDEKQT